MGRTISDPGTAGDIANRVRHTCHAKGCNRAIAARFLMCGRHWAMVPPKLQIAVYRQYRPGQEIDKQPSHDYLVAMWRAILAVAQKEGKPLNIFEEDRQRAIAHFGVEPPALSQVLQEKEIHQKEKQDGLW